MAPIALASATMTPGHINRIKGLAKREADPLPEKAVSSFFELPCLGEVEAITQWWRADEAEALGLEGFPDIDIVSGKPTGYTIVTRLSRSANGETFCPVPCEDD